MSEAGRSRDHEPDKAREFFSDFRVSRRLAPAWPVFLSVALGFSVSVAALTQLDARLKTPVALILASAGVSVLLATTAPTSVLAAVAASMWTLSAVGVNVAAILRYYRAEEPSRTTKIILGWTQRAPVSPGSLGRIVDNVLRDALCSVLVVSGRVPQRVQRILVPVTRGPHSEKALQLAG